MAIGLPQERTYYAISRDKPDRLLCWIPEQELVAWVQRRQCPASLLKDHPGGLEIEVSERAYQEAGLVLPSPAMALERAYLDLHSHGRLPPSGYVQGAYLEQMTCDNLSPMLDAAADMIAEPDGNLPVGQAPEPTMSPGEEPLAVFRRLARREDR